MSRLDLTARAKAIINATPLEPMRDDSLRGLDYLEDTRRVLREHGILDPDLEALAEAVHALPGPWCARLAPPRLQP